MASLGTSTPAAAAETGLGRPLCRPAQSADITRLRQTADRNRDGGISARHPPQVEQTAVSVGLDTLTGQRPEGNGLSIRLSVRLSVCLSVYLPVGLCVCGAAAMLVGWLSRRATDGGCVSPRPAVFQYQMISPPH